MAGLAVLSRDSFLWYRLGLTSIQLSFAEGALDIVQSTRKNPNRSYLEPGLGGPKKSPDLVVRVRLPVAFMLDENGLPTIHKK